MRFPEELGSPGQLKIASDSWPKEVVVGDAVWTVWSDPSNGNFDLTRPLSTGQKMRVRFWRCAHGLLARPHSVMAIDIDESRLGEFEDTDTISPPSIRAIITAEIGTVINALYRAGLRKEFERLDREEEERQRAIERARDAH